MGSWLLPFVGILGALPQSSLQCLISGPSCCLRLHPLNTTEVNEPIAHWSNLVNECRAQTCPLGCLCKGLLYSIHSWSQLVFSKTLLRVRKPASAQSTCWLSVPYAGSLHSTQKTGQNLLWKGEITGLSTSFPSCSLYGNFNFYYSMIILLNSLSIGNLLLWSPWCAGSFNILIPMILTDPLKVSPVICKLQLGKLRFWVRNKQPKCWPTAGRSVWCLSLRAASSSPPQAHIIDG